MALVPLGVAAWLAWYLIACLFFPFADCRWCHRERAKPLRKQKPCRWCGDTRLRRRWGRALIAEARKARKRARSRYLP